MLRSAAIRVLDDRDTDAVLDLLHTDPVGHVYVAGRVLHAGVDPWRLGAELWGHVVARDLVALCYAGANLVPVVGPGQDASLALFADRARRQGRRCSSIVGYADAVLPLWQSLRPTWGQARDVRAEQPLLVLDGPPLLPPDPLVRRVRPEELDVLLPACVAMYTEEIGFSPVAGDGGSLYRARVAELISQGRAFARIDDGAVVFKAEVGAASDRACQVQGVWVAPALRGLGIGAAGTAAVAVAAQQTIAPTVSLYVNAHNTAARRAYQRVGFAERGTFASVLF